MVNAERFNIAPNTIFCNAEHALNIEVAVVSLSKVATDKSILVNAVQL